MDSPYTLITGASSGIGKELALALAHERNLILVARSEELLEGVGQRCRKGGKHVIVIKKDLQEQNAAYNLFQQCQSKQYNVNFLINNAGFAVTGEVEATNLDRVTKMLMLNCVVLTQLTQLFLPSIIESKGMILNVSSHAAFQPVPFMSAYAASKAYVLHYTEGLAYEMLAKEVKVCALCPGATESDFWTIADLDPASTKMSLMKADAVAKIGLKAVAQGKSSVIPGYMNNITSFSGRLVPRSLLAFISAKMVGH